MHKKNNQFCWSLQNIISWNCHQVVRLEIMLYILVNSSSLQKYSSTELHHKKSLITQPNPHSSNCKSYKIIFTKSIKIACTDLFLHNPSQPVNVYNYNAFYFNFSPTEVTAAFMDSMCWSANYHTKRKQIFYYLKAMKWFFFHKIKCLARIWSTKKM